MSYGECYAERKFRRRARVRRGVTTAFTEVRRDVYYDCGICIQTSGVGGVLQTGGEYLHETDLEAHMLSHGHFMCTMRVLQMQESDAARCEIFDRWREHMPTLRWHWGVYRRRRRDMLEMASVTEDMMGEPVPRGFVRFNGRCPRGCLENLLGFYVKNNPLLTKASFVALVAKLQDES